jgi:UDP-N-acetylglucosamine 4,6-dehydratase
MHNHLIGLPRRAKQALMIGTDAVILSAIVWAAFALRLEHPLPPQLLEVWWLMLAVPAVAIPCFALMGLYLAVVRYLGAQAAVAVLKGVTLSTLAFIALVAATRVDESVPRTVYVLYWLLATLAVGGTRFAARAWLRSMLNGYGNQERVVVYGAGAAGVQLVQTLATTREYQPALFVDDNPALQGKVVHGLKVYSPDRLEDLVVRQGLRLVLLAIPSASRARRREIVNRLEHLSIHVKTMPGMADILSGKARIDEIREVDIDDLLGRDPVAPSTELMDRCIRGKNVLVTGAGGSIGSELCRQIIRRAPATLVLLERNEYALYSIDRELRAEIAEQGLAVRVVPLLGTVLRRRRAERVMRAYHVHTVYHAAAYKHVPMVETNVLEGVQNNIFGTLHTARAAEAAGVERFVLVSTDKAVRPTNVMGATKRFAELILQAMAEAGRGKTCFAMVRFGNVLGSSGSVVPLFRAQIEAGGPVTVTHPEVTRYFMTIPEAAALVIQAGAMAEGGDVFVLDMGESVKILDLARKMIHLSGFEVQDENHPDGDIPIAFTGLRPGEKLYEELLLGNNVTATAHPMIMRAQEEMLSLRTVNTLLEGLKDACAAFDPEAARAILCRVVDGYEPEGGTHDLLWHQLQKRAPQPDNVQPLRLEAPEGHPRIARRTH